MKLQRRFNRKVGGKEYSKWVVVLPNEKVQQVGWKEGIELEINRTKKGILELKSKDGVQ